MTPTTPEGLARVAAAQRRPSSEGPVAWVSMHSRGAVIAIVRGATVLYSRTIAWKYDPAPRTNREQLLQRYVLVMHLAPELQHGMAVVKETHGATVRTVITCGNLAERRALTMPLIDELRLEVETLDSVRPATVPVRLPVRPRRPAVAMAAILAAAVLTAGYFVSQDEPVDPPPAAASPPLEVPHPNDTAASTGGEAETAPVSSLGSQPAPAAAPDLPPVRRLPPVPSVTSILLAGDRRLAVMGGSIVAVGDTVGSRVVVRIDEYSVTLRDASHRVITVPMRRSAQIPGQG